MERPASLDEEPPLVQAGTTTKGIFGARKRGPIHGTESR
jgi:hypothetical protein